MRPSSRVASGFFAAVILAGCASSQVVSRQQYEGERLPRPNRIWVYDFASSAADVPAGSSLAGAPAAQSTPPTAEEMEAARKLGAEVAKDVVEEIQGMGLPASQATAQTRPQVGDYVLKGYFVTVDEGSAGKRIMLGFGSGAANLTTSVEGYQVTPTGLRLLGSGEVQSGGNKTPGLIVPIAVVAATANPIGLIIGGAAKAYGQASGSDTIEGMGKRTAKTIGEQLRGAFQRQGWI
jgi:hypothetical protein